MPILVQEIGRVLTLISFMFIEMIPIKSMYTIPVMIKITYFLFIVF